MTESILVPLASAFWLGIEKCKHRWLKAWHLDGTLVEVKARLLGIAQSYEPDSLEIRNS